GEPLSATKAEQWGMVEEVVPNGQVLEAARALAARFAQVPDVPLRMTKQSINMTAQALNLATSYMDRDQFALAAQSPEQADAISSFLTSSHSNTQTK
ncbi:MAG: enoyl-CoA hydratase/isomerase family protein, partial [Parvibaculaceae bacterium]|nr:enoyl-CoA hydratase/isomerase family protein [Parvibaculaceae bacterium]